MKYFYILFAFSAITLISCSDDSTTQVDDPIEYTNANGLNGGMLFDKFWSKEGGYDQNSPNLAVFNAKSDFFRCKQCHAWDLAGRNGSYISRGPKTTRPNVVDRNLFESARNLTAQELFNAIKLGLGHSRRPVDADLSTYDPTNNPTVGDQMPDFSQILTDAQIWDIVKFLKVEALDVKLLYDALYEGTYPAGKATFSNIGRDGDAAKGLPFYVDNCAFCHGVDGTDFLIEDMTVGKFTRSKPNEVQHKVKFGQLGSIMKATVITVADMKNLYKALADTVNFPN